MQVEHKIRCSNISTTFPNLLIKFLIKKKIYKLYIKK